MSETQIEKPRRSYIDMGVADKMELSPSGGMALSNAGQLMEFAKMMSIGGISVPKHLRDNAGACLAVVVQAHEWQMSPFAVANKSYSVNDRLAYEAQLVYAVILRRAPIKGRFKTIYTGEGDARRCKVTATLTDGDTVEYESPAFGRIPVKNSPLWKSDPDQQLFYYTARACCRRHFPDVLLGIYTQDEVRDGMDAREERNVTPPAKVLPPPHLREPEPPADPDQQGDVGEEWDGERGDEGGDQ